MSSISMRERIKQEKMMENPLPTDRNYISNAADATPRRRCNTSHFGRFGPRRFCQELFGGHVHNRSYPSNSPLPALSNPSMYQNSSKMLRCHRTISVLRLPTSSLPYLMVRNRCCGYSFYLPILFLLPGLPEALRSLLYQRAPRLPIYSLTF